MERDHPESATLASPMQLFDGDTGVLSIPVREALVAVLKRKYLSEQEHPQLWPVLLNNEDAIRSRLHELFVDLIVDRQYGVAYKQQADPGDDEPFPTVLRQDAYTREETALMLHLRRVLRRATADGADTAVVDAEELQEAVAQHWPTDLTDKAAATGRATAAVKRLTKDRLLLPVSEDRYRIAPILEALLPVDMVAELARSVERLVEHDSPDCDDEEEALA